MNTLKKYDKSVYIVLLSVLTVALLLDYVPNDFCKQIAGLVTPPVALFVGLACALLFGQAYPKFNKKMSKYLLQYSVVGLGFGMNLVASLKSGISTSMWAEAPQR